MDDILQIKREHITEPIKRSIKIYGNKPQRLALILNMAITELVLLISKMLEAARAIRNKILHTDVTTVSYTHRGDTGKAALAGFADVPGTSIIVFYPKNGVSPIQEKQMLTQKGENTNVVGIIGNFDAVSYTHLIR